MKNNELKQKLEGVVKANALDTLSGRALANAINNTYSEVFSKTYFYELLNPSILADDFSDFRGDALEWGNKIRHMAEGAVFSKDRETSFIPTAKTVKSRIETITTGRIERQIQNTYPQFEFKKNFQSGEGYANWLAGQDMKTRKSMILEELNSFKYIFGAKTSAFLPAEVKTQLDPIKTMVSKHVKVLKTNATSILDVIGELRELTDKINATESDQWNIGSATDGADLASGIKPMINTWNIKESGILIMSIYDKKLIANAILDKYDSAWFTNFKSDFYKVIELDIPSGTFYLLDKNVLKSHNYFETMDLEYYPNNLTYVNQLHYDKTFTVVPFLNGLKLTFTLA